MKRFTVTGLTILILGITGAARLAAWESYHDPALDDQGYCTTCHPGFSAGFADTLHALHTGGSAPVTTNCNLCHTGGNRDNPLVMWSVGDNSDGLGCTGCHGRDYEETIQGNYLGFATFGKAKSSGYGLRLHHADSGIGVCAPCHNDAGQDIEPESVNPSYYARGDVGFNGTPLDACDNEDSPNDTDDEGLDNDGDLLYEDADPDCSVTLPDINLDPSALDFGTVLGGESKSLTVQVENLGSADLTVSAINLCAGTSSEFTWSPDAPFLVAPGASQALMVTYTPTDDGTDVGCLSLDSDDPDAPEVLLDVIGTSTSDPQSDITLDPGSLDFGTVLIRTTASKPVEIRNDGTADLIIWNISYCVDTSREYSWRPSPLLIIPPRSSQTLTVTYAPLDVGSDPGCLLLDTNDPDQPTVTLDITGAGTDVKEADIDLDPSSLDFGTIGVGSSSILPVEVRNPGTDWLVISSIALCGGTSAEYSWLPSAPLTIARGGSATLFVTYSPTNVGTDAGCLELSSNDPDEPVVALDVSGTGTDTAEPDISLDPSALDFGSVLIGGSSSLTTDIRNLGASDLVVSSISLCAGTTSEYGWMPDAPLTIPPGGTETVTVTYSPTDAGADTGCLTIASNDPDESSVQLDLSGSGGLSPEPDIALDPSALDFGTVLIGGSANLTTQVRNLGSADLVVSSISLCGGTSAEYDWMPDAPLTIAPGASRTLTVTYSPVNSGMDTGCLSIQSNDPDESTVELDLSGMGGEQPEPDIALDPSALDFGNVAVGGASSLTTEIRNTGTANLQVSGIALCTGTSTEYGWMPDAPLTIAPGASRTLTVTYAPLDTGLDTGCLEIQSNDPDEGTVVLDLSGMGADTTRPDITLDPALLDFGTLPVGGSSSLTAVIGNVGSANLVVSAIALCAGTSTEYGWMPVAPLTISPGASELLTVTYAPTDAGSDVGCLAIASNDPDEGTLFLGLKGQTESAVLPGACFRRADSNVDALVDISDGINTLGALFLGTGVLTCDDAADANDSGEVDIADAVFTFNYLFLGGPSPAAPGPQVCAPDPTEDDLDCKVYDADCECLQGISGTLAGTVTNDLTGAGIPDVPVSIEPALDGVSVVTDANGNFSQELPSGIYMLTVEVPNFVTHSESTLVKPGEAVIVEIALEPVAPVIVIAATSGDSSPEGVLSALASVEILDGSTLESYSWTQQNSVDVTIDDADQETATVTLPDEGEYKAELFHVLMEPPISEEHLPPNVELPEGEFPGGLQDRFHVVGVNPFNLEETGLVTLHVEVTTSSGTYTDEVEVHTHLPWKPTAGVRAVPLDIPVLLYGKSHVDEDQNGLNDVTGMATTYDWALVAPGGSSAVLEDATAQNPVFTPDVSGLYTLTVTNTTEDPGTDVVTIEIYAGTWRGMITGQDADGRPLADDCTGCHDGGFAPDQFTPWAQTGHAEIFTNNLNTSTHYGSRCFACHTVGYDPEADNGGVDEASDYEDFLASGLINNPGDNWTTVLADYPDTAQMANIQCENCHGPQSGGTHMQTEARTDLSSNVCATCHGEPLRHARFQQWQLSSHANYELAEDESQSGTCSKCHTANGFLAWLPALLEGDPGPGVPVTWTADESHPQTCATCHDPHAIGTTSGNDSNATVRISGSTPPLLAGFTAVGVGRGAICMTCHNSRRGLRNDNTYDGTDTARAPHGSAQTDVLMGQNAYLVDVGVRGSHSFATDTCANCHMEQTPPPDLLAYNQGGTNHTFGARTDICVNCHGEVFEAEGVQSGVNAGLEELQGLQEQAILDVMEEQIALGNAIDLNGGALVTDVADIKDLVFGEYHGRQSITVTFTDDSVVGPNRMNDVDVVDASSAVLGELYDFTDERVIKSGWNYGLIHNDGSHGIHNPTFSTRVLDASIDALNQLAEEPPDAPVVLGVSTEGAAEPGASFTASVQVGILDGSTLESISWTQHNSVPVTIDGVDTAAATVTLADEDVYKEELFLLLAEPPISEDQLPPGVELPEGEFPGGLQNRFHVVGLNPFVLEETGMFTLEVTVVTTSGTYTEELEMHAHLPWKPASGLEAVPLGIPVLLHGKSHVDEDDNGINDVTGLATTYDWALLAPAGSSTVLEDATGQNPVFTPDVSGLYTVTVTNTTEDPGTDVVTIEIYAGTWRGMITGQDADGRPLAADCTGCHDGGFAPDQFTPWAQTGHAEIFTNNLNTSTHYGSRCFACHMVGYDPEVDNGGVDEASDYGAFLASGLLNNPGDNWTTVLADYPETAQMANIQCENCHGPQSGGTHMQTESRTGLSSDVCATCHGEPLRHARFQQWQLSSHANYELAEDESQSGTCSKCHTANGFLAWLPALEAGDPGPSVPVTWTADESHPQTCATCHDPHAIGTTTGTDTNATVRISGTTPPLLAGFTAVGVGRGAICMTCHNSRRGLRNDSTYNGTDTERSPHGPTQTDMIMGQNAYFVEVGVRGGHSFVTDTCANCHMEQTPPPDILSYNQGGTNHTFSARVDICSNCHGDGFDAEGVIAGVEAGLEELQGLQEEAILVVMEEQIALGNTISLNGEAVISDIAQVKELIFGEYHGRQAITVVFTDDTVIGPHRLPDVDVLDPADAVLGALYSFADSRVHKSGWNWLLVHNDGSHGVHNPSYASQILSASVNALTELAAE